jgi:signal transduction histidine kinase
VIKEYSQELPEIMADETKLRQLFLNLFINSLQFMPDGGKLQIKTYVRDFLNSEYLFVDVSDTGPGIDESDLEKIFDPFFTTREEGTGLGLTICQNVVDSHKGNIWIRNNEKEGVTVTVSFPIPDKESHEEEQE